MTVKSISDFSRSDRTLRRPKTLGRYACAMNHFDMPEKLRLYRLDL